MLAAPLGNTVLEYLVPSGRMVRELPKALVADFNGGGPSQIRATGKGDFVLELTNDWLVTLSSSLRVKNDKRFLVVTPFNEKSPGSTAPRIESLWGWTLAGDDVMGYGDISFDGRERWESGVFRFPMSTPGDFEILSSSPYNGQDSSRIFFRLDMPFFAALEDKTDPGRGAWKGYVLLMKDRLGIYRSAKGQSDLEFVMALPKGLEASPALPEFRRREDLPSVMRAIEQSALPAGLWAWNRHLYLLSRAPVGTKTQWTLTKIDPETPRFVGSTVLPTQANHLTVVPGPRWWALVEKGPVLGFGAQSVDSAMLIPSDALRGSMRVRFVTE
jgi:hypothetical protein